MISIKNLSKSFDDLEVFKNIDLDINDGDALVIIGGSGCGKSTLLRCINRLVEPDSGQVFIDDKDILAKDADVDGIRRNMGMVYQHFNLFSHLNVLENVIEAPMKVLGMKQEEAIAEAIKYLKLVGLEQWKYHMPSQLSGGQKQRVAIARTLAMHPKYILFDEPTSALDPTMVGEVESVIKGLVETGITSVIVTHEMRFAKSIASKVIFLAEKGIYESGTAAEVFDNPKKPLTREFLFNSRMLRKVITLGADTESIITEFREFLNRYEFDSKQMNLFRIVIDELVLPALTDGICNEIEMRLVCSDSSTKHKIYLNARPTSTEKLGNSDLFDDLNIAILKAYFLDIQKARTDDYAEVVLSM